MLVASVPFYQKSKTVVADVPLSQNLYLPYVPFA